MNKKPKSKSPQKVLEKKIPQYIIGAFSIVAALAWNDLVKDLFKRYKADDNTFWFKLLYSISATLILVFVAVFVYKCNCWYHSIKEHAVRRLLYYKKAVCRFQNNGHIAIDRIKNNKLILYFNMHNMKSNRTYRIEIMKCDNQDPTIINLQSTHFGHLNHRVITSGFNIVDILDQRIDIYEHGNPTYIHTSSVQLRTKK